MGSEDLSKCWIRTTHVGSLPRPNHSNLDMEQAGEQGFRLVLFWVFICAHGIQRFLLNGFSWEYGAASRVLFRAFIRVDWGPGPQVIAEQETAAVDIINDGEWVP